MKKIVLAFFVAFLAAGAFGVANSRGDFSTEGIYAWPGALFVHVDVSPSGGGWVRSTPYLLDCPSVCTRPVAAGTALTLQAYASNNYAFLGWDPAGPCAASTLTTCTFTATAAKTEVTAIFKYDPPAPPINQENHTPREEGGE